MASTINIPVSLTYKQAEALTGSDIVVTVTIGGVELIRIVNPQDLTVYRSDDELTLSATEKSKA